MKRWIYHASLLLLLLLSSTSLFPQALTLGAVQFEVSEELLQSEDCYRSAVAEAAELAVEAGSELVVFPEYIGAFLTALAYSDELEGAESLLEALRSILEKHPTPEDLERIFLTSAPQVSRSMDAIFGALARRLDVHVLAGTYFERIDSPGPGDELRNRAVVYGPEGRRVYTQDKVFLTELERELLGLDPGDIRRADGFEIDGVNVGVTICRDTFFENWNRVHGDTDLWIDIKADGVAYDEAARKRYWKTVPERITDTGVPYGATVSLVGDFLEFFWEGRSSVIRNGGGRVAILDAADSPREPDIIVETITLPARAVGD